MRKIYEFLTIPCFSLFENVNNQACFFYSKAFFCSF